MIQILIRPVITEKTMREAGINRFTFAVNRAATKDQIKKAVQDAFKVDVLRTETSIVKGRTHRSGRRRKEIVESSWKKAILTLKPNQKIDYFDVTEEAHKHA